LLITQYVMADENVVKLVNKRRDRILVVEDDADARELMEAVLTQAGYKVDVAEDGFVALDKLAQLVPDLMLTDMRMPGMHGVDLIHRVKQIRDDVPAVLTTGVDNFDLETAAEGYGAVACLIKPINLEDLLWTIECALACRVSKRRKTFGMR
jgi:DNA-binding NtrC family response regulator